MPEIRCLIVSSLWIVWLGIVSIGEVQTVFGEDSPRGHLRLTTGDFVHGRIVGSSRPNHFDWQCDAFDSPLTIDVIHLQRIETGQALATDSIDGLFHFSLNGSDAILATWVDGDSEKLTLRSPTFGPFEVSTSYLSQVRRVDPPRDVIFRGFALEDTADTIQLGATWEIKGTSLVSEKPGERLTTDARLADRSRIDLRVSWEGKPQFVIALAVDQREESYLAAPRLEVWDNSLVLVQQHQGDADAVFLRELAASESEIALVIYHDQSSGKVAVFSAAGKLLGKIQLKQKRQPHLSSIAVQNLGTRWSLDSFVVSRWDGELPYPHGDANSSVAKPRRDLSGRILGFDRESQQLRVEASRGEIIALPVDQLATWVSTNADKDIASPTGDAGLPRVQVTMRDGSQVTGELLDSELETLRLKTKYSDAPLVCPPIV